MLLGGLDGVVARTEGLDQHPPAALPAPRPSRHLRQEVERPLAGPKIRQVERGVRRDHADEGHLREVEPLGDHLRADEEAHLPRLDRLVEVAVAAAARRGVPIHPGDWRDRKEPVQLGLHPLRPGPPEPEVALPALAAELLRWLVEIAVVADQLPAAGVVDQGDGAARAPLDRPARVALRHPREPPPVEQEHRLLPALHGLLQRALQAMGEGPGAMPARQLLPHVDDLRLRQLPPRDALRQRREAPRPPRRGMVALHGRGGAPQHHGGAGEPRAGCGDLAGVVTGGVSLLVGRLVLLVDEDEAEVPHGGEDRRAGPDHDPAPSLGQPPPVIGPLPRAQAAVPHRDQAAEALGEAVRRLRGERDLRDEADGGAPLAQRAVDRLEVELGLP